MKIAADKGERIRLFIELTDYLKYKKKVTFSGAGKVMGMSGDKVTNIRRGGSTPTNEELVKLITAYPELKDLEITKKYIIFEEDPEVGKDRFDKLEEENEKLKDDIEEMRKMLIPLYRMLFKDRALEVFMKKDELTEEEWQRIYDEVNNKDQGEQNK